MGRGRYGRGRGRGGGGEGGGRGGGGGRGRSSERGYGGGGGGGGHGGWGGPAKRGRFMRRDFKDGRPNEWRGDSPAGRGEGRGGDEEQGDGRQQNGAWNSYVYENAALESYYKTQKIVGEDEWEDFLACMRTHLPTTFRINGSGKFAHEIRDQMQRDFFDLLKDKKEVDGEVLEPPRPLPWYPDNLAWHLSFSRMQLRKMPLLGKVFDFMKRENEIGSITRQEAVSMVPPLLLDVQPHHRVLDMCAAPGSKTFQLLEMLHQGGNPAVIPAGVVIANDVDVQRCHLLVHQTQRMCSPAILVTNHEAQMFPSLHKKGGPTATPAAAPGEGALDEDQLWFDRILCDVPCSGDGTLRKAPDIWRKWNAAVGCGLHPLQVRIAMRGVALLKVGGRLIYSTCSLNPVENEAVVAQVLRESGGAMELLETSEMLPELKRRPGLRSWKVKGRSEWYTSYCQAERGRNVNVGPSMFPSGNTTGPSPAPPAEPVEVGNGDANPMEEDGKEAGEGKERPDRSGDPPETCPFPLERCLRVVPHDQDTGGFFVAVMQKVAPLTALPPLSSRDRHRMERGILPRHIAEEQAAAAAAAGSEKQADGEPPVASEAPLPSSDTPRATEADGPALAEAIIVEDEGGDVAGEDEVTSAVVGASAVNGEEGGLGEGIDEGHDEPTVEDAFPGEERLSVGAPAGIIVDDAMEGSGKPEDIVEDSGKAVAVVEQTEVAAEGTEGANEAEEGGQGGAPGDSKRYQQQGRWRGVDPVIFLTDEGILTSLEDYYGLPRSFLETHLVTRSDDIARVKRLYYVCSAVGDIIRQNFATGEHLKIVSTGLKLFERQSVKDPTVKCAYRITSEGLPLILPHLTRQILHCNAVDFRHLLANRNVAFDSFTTPETTAGLQAALPGCVVMVLQRTLANSGATGEETDVEEAGARRMAVGVWRGKNGVSLLVTKVETQQLLERLKLPSPVEASTGPETAVAEAEGKSIEETRSAAQPVSILCVGEEGGDSGAAQQQKGDPSIKVEAALAAAPQAEVAATEANATTVAGVEATAGTHAAISAGSSEVPVTEDVRAKGPGVQDAASEGGPLQQ
eukprot:TRINITY_DN5426_c0_g2_i1.p1 TRINITY_DN5426_c0_g2~~TRINITY_DN5426_c0_g2_i1.p1  ORF type:complete len:1077 (+),score=238.17 TRINITY_DN5426_c0_g2_i1:140-3370(+)